MPDQAPLIVIKNARTKKVGNHLAQGFSFARAAADRPNASGGTGTEGKSCRFLQVPVNCLRNGERPFAEHRAQNLDIRRLQNLLDLLRRHSPGSVRFDH
jgi:hypothetical protein